MADFTPERARRFYAETYDTVVSDWPGEIEFYTRLGEELVTQGEQILEIASGTGRITIRLAQRGFDVFGLDSSPAMIAVAKEKNAGLDNIQWIKADMRSIELGQSFPLVIIPAHSFQNLITVDDHLVALESIRRHLSPNGKLIIHIDHLRLDWLNSLIENGGDFSPSGSFVHPRTKQKINTKQSWTYDPVTQTATLETVWEAVGEDGEVLKSWESGPLQFHCFFRFEMVHLLHRSGYEILGVYGDFSYGKLTDVSSEMIWVAKKS
jgi:SAM-dependent methyltransferase